MIVVRFYDDYRIQEHFQQEHKEKIMQCKTLQQVIECLPNVMLSHVTHLRQYTKRYYALGIKSPGTNWIRLVEVYE